MSCWVVNASPLIYLAHLDRLDLLRQGASEILVPPAVLLELAAKPDASTARIDAARLSWLRRVSARFEATVAEEFKGVILLTQSPAGAQRDLDRRAIGFKTGSK